MLLLAIFLPLAAALVRSGQSISSDLQSLLSSGSEVVCTSDNASYAAANFTPRYDIAEPPSYLVAVKPALVTDVQKVVKYVLQKKVPFLATGGGHGYTTSLGKLKNGIDLDLGFFNGVQIDKPARTVTIGGAVHADQLVSALQEAGLEIVVGQCPCIGYAGASLGGGIGPYSGLYGPMSDSLLSAEMVTGTGELLNVSSKENSDLLYGLKGAGFNYGVVTSLTYKVYPATNDGKTMVANMVFPGEQSEDIWKLAKSLAATQPKELSMAMSVAFNATLNSISFTVSFIYAGPQSSGVPLIQPFLDLQPSGLEIETVDWVDVPAVSFYGYILLGGCTSGAYYEPFAVNVYQVDVPNLVKVVDYMNSTIAANETLAGVAIAWAQYSTHGFQLQPADSSAFPYRDVVSYVQIDGSGTDATQLPAISQFSRKVRDMLQEGSGKQQLEAYVHFAHGDESPAEMYSAANLAKLLSLKKKYDPENLFSWYNPVLPTT